MIQGRRLLYLSLIVVFVLAFAVRLYPLVWSPYPYNIDGLAEARMAEDIEASGHLTLPDGSGYWDSYIPDMPVLNLLLATFSELVGISPLHASQIFVALLGATSCLFAAIFVHRISGNLRAGVFAGVLLALLGTYVFCTTSVWKEALGLTLMIVIFTLYLERSDLRIRAVMTLALLLMVFVHHHSAVLTFMIFSFAIASEAYRDRRSDQLTWRNCADIGTALAAWSLAAVYYCGIDLPYYQFLSPEQDLYLFVAVSAAMFMLLLVAMSSPSRSRERPYLKLVVPAVAASVLLVNYVRPIFPGVPATEGAVLLFSAAYLILIVPVWSSYERLSGSNAAWKPLALSLLLAPLTMMLFAFLRGLDLMSYTIAYRSFDFLDLGLAALFGMGAAIIVRAGFRRSIAVSMAFMLLLVSTTPIAFQTEGLFSVQNQTYEYEVDLLESLRSLSADKTLDSDQKIGTISRSLFNFSGETDLALRVDTGEPTDEFQWLVLKSTWTERGAQQFPFGQLVISEDIFDSFLGENDVVALAGPFSDQMIVVSNP